MNFGDSLKRFRQELALTQQQVADKIGCHKQAYQRYESGKVVPSVLVMAKIADAYNVSIDYLVGRTDNPSVNK